MPSISNQERENLCHLSCWPAGQCNNAQTMYLFSLYHSQTVAYWPLRSIKSLRPSHIYSDIVNCKSLFMVVYGGMPMSNLRLILGISSIFSVNFPKKNPWHFPHTVRQVLSSALPFRHWQLDHILSTPAMTRKRTLNAAVRPTTRLAQIAIGKVQFAPCSNTTSLKELDVACHGVSEWVKCIGNMLAGVWHKPIYIRKRTRDFLQDSPSGFV